MSANAARDALEAANPTMAVSTTGWPDLSEFIGPEPRDVWRLQWSDVALGRRVLCFKQDRTDEFRLVYADDFHAVRTRYTFEGRYADPTGMFDVLLWRSDSRTRHLAFTLAPHFWPAGQATPPPAATTIEANPEFAAMAERENVTHTRRGNAVVIAGAAR
jgi:hypothetical protein